MKGKSASSPIRTCLSETCRRRLNLGSNVAIAEPARGTAPDILGANGMSTTDFADIICEQLG